jgi:hypothetical protein
MKLVTKIERFWRDPIFKQCRARLRDMSSAKARCGTCSAILVVYMRIVRRRLSWVVGAWMLCQAAAVASAPLALWRTSLPAVGAIADDCCPGVAPGQVCPMHHTKEGGRKCAMRSACSPDSAALVSLSGIVGLPSRAFTKLAESSLSSSLGQRESATLARSTRPESPPPRA